MARRNRIGTKRQDLCQWEYADSSQLQSACGVQEYIQQMIRAYVAGKIPQAHYQAVLLDPPKGRDTNVWILEMLREFCQELNFLVSALEVVCSPVCCPKMMHQGQQVLFAAKRGPQACCAIDYVVRTLEATTALLNNPKYFPSRMTVRRESAQQHFGSVARRLFRIFSHAHARHRETLDSFNSKTHLLRRFTTFVGHHELMRSEDLALS
eukprot:g3818.t1